MNLRANVLNGEAEVFGRMLVSKKCDGVKGMLKLAHEYKAAFPTSCKLSCELVTFWHFYCCLQYLFSFLQIKLSKQRLTVTHERKNNFTLLAYESDLINNLNTLLKFLKASTHAD